MRKFISRCRANINQLLALRAERGPYRYLLRSWSGISDIDVAVNVLNTEFFRYEVCPLPLPVEKLSSILVLAPHQDDEAIGAGGSLLMASAAGVKIDVLYVTDGAQSAASYAPGPSETSAVRDGEAAAACARLGAGMYRLGVSNLRPRPTPADVERLSELISRLKPQVIMAPWLLDAPPKHRLVNHLLWLADKHGRLPDCEVWGYQVHNTPYANGYVDITPVAEQKRELLECYGSQNDHIRRYDHMTMGLAAWNARFLKNCLEPQYAEIFFTLPSRELLRLVEKFYLPNVEAVYRGGHEIISGLRGLEERMGRNARRPGKAGAGAGAVKSTA